MTVLTMAGGDGGKETETVQKIKEVSLLEKDRGNWTPGCWEPVLLTIYHYQCAVKIE